MDTRSVPARLRTLPSRLVSQVATAAQQTVGARFAAVGTNRGQYAMLAALEEFGPASQAALGRQVGLDRSDVTAAVAALDERRLVERGPDPSDRRRNTVRITAAGRRHLASLDRLVASAQDELLAPLSAGERRQLTALLARLVDHHAPSD